MALKLMQYLVGRRRYRPVIKREHHAEATIKISGRTLFAETRSADMYSAMDQLMDRLDRQIIKAKEKMQHRQHDSIADAIS